MPFAANLTGTTEVDSSILTAYAQGFLVAYGQENVMDALVQMREDIGAKAIELPRYARLALATTPLTETEDVTSEALNDTKVVLTPAEYGNVVTKTALASLQTGGKVDLAIAQLVGINASQTMDKLAILALDASGNTTTVTGGAASGLAGTDVMTRAYINRQYNKLARANVPTIGGSYAMVAHDDVIHDVRADTSSGSWTDVAKYATPETVMKNEVGMIGGFRVIRNNQATFGDQAGAGTVDAYNSYFLGFNALGKATSQPLSIRFTGPFDKLGRFVNVGWYSVTKYQIIESDAVQVGVTASSVGFNAA